MLRVVSMEPKGDQNWAAVGATSLGVILVLVSLPVGWGELDWQTSGGFFGGASRQSDYTLFELENVGWYDEDVDDASGIDSIRVAIPLVLVGGALGLVAVIALALPLGPAGAAHRVGALLAFGAGVLLLVGAALHLIGANELADEFTGSGGGMSADASISMGLGTILAFAAGALAVVGGRLAFRSAPSRRADGGSAF